MSQSLHVFRTDDAAAFAMARAIRDDVFCREQGVSAAEEWDGRDDACTHFLLSENHTPIATARVRPYAQRTYKVERVAVLKPHRRKGVGSAIMQAVLRFIRDIDGGDGEVILHSQIAVADFYAHLGFRQEGEVFTEAGIPHIAMRFGRPRGS